MGLWDTVKKIAQGKPVFENPENIGPEHRDDVESAEVVVPVRPGFDEKGSKIIPIIRVTGCRTDTSGSRMQVWAWIKNTAAMPVRIERVSLIGQTRQLANFLTPGEQEQVLIYDGPRPRITSYTKAELFFMQPNTNDYFCAEHIIHYSAHPDGTYTVNQLEPYDYVRDV